MLSTITNIISIDFLARFSISLISMIFIVWFCYFRRSPRKDYLFGFMLFGIGVFIITKMLHDVQLPMGFAFGLFALFSMLRYRTESISIKEMTYLFLVIGVALITAIAPLHYFELIIINAIICCCAQIAEVIELKLCESKRIDFQMVRYDLIENIKPQNRDLLINDLHQRTGLNIIDVHIDEIDLLRDTAMLKVVFSTQKIVAKDAIDAGAKESNTQCEPNQRSAFVLSD